MHELIARAAEEVERTFGKAMSSASPSKRALRDADPDALVPADGFSCRTQIRELAAERKPMHLAQVIVAALSARESGTRAAQIVNE